MTRKSTFINTEQHRSLAILAANKGTTISGEIESAISVHLEKEQRKLQRQGHSITL